MVIPISWRGGCLFALRASLGLLVPVSFVSPPGLLHRKKKLATPFTARHIITIFSSCTVLFLSLEYRRQQDTDLARPNPGPKSQSQTVPKAEQSLNKYLSNESFLWNFIAPHFRSWYFRSRISRTKTRYLIPSNRLWALTNCRHPVQQVCRRLK